MVHFSRCTLGYNCQADPFTCKFLLHTPKISAKWAILCGSVSIHSTLLAKSTISVLLFGKVNFTKQFKNKILGSSIKANFCTINSTHLFIIFIPKLHFIPLLLVLYLLQNSGMKNIKLSLRMFTLVSPSLLCARHFTASQRIMVSRVLLHTDTLNTNQGRN